MKNEASIKVGKQCHKSGLGANTTNIDNSNNNKACHCYHQYKKQKGLVQSPRSEKVRNR